MKVLVFESNLLWVSKVTSGMKAAGHLPQHWSHGQPVPQDAGLAIVGLEGNPDTVTAGIHQLVESGVPVLGHASHSQKEWIQLGRQAGCNRVITNGEAARNLAHHANLVILLGLDAKSHGFQKPDG